jgi:A/G-specific adenine glycosylase
VNNHVHQFQEKVWDYYAHNRRQLTWRQPDAGNHFDPYKIMVSEIMLQQTQVNRVIPKYLSFITRFADVSSLAQAKFADVLQQWNGLGYNRRAKYLLDAAQMIQRNYHGVVPSDAEELVNLPGIGKNTAAAICVYAYNQPHVFIETNIRTVFIHEFYNDREGVHDKELIPLIQESLHKENPREWYWALMDYGTFVKSNYGNASRHSMHYTKQTAFEGSTRQLRAKTLRILLNGPCSQNDIKKKIPDSRLNTVLTELMRENLITFKNNRYQLD